MLPQLLAKLRHRNWPEATAHVQSCKRFGGYAGRFGVGHPSFYGVMFIYSVDGKTYDGELASGIEMEPHSAFPVRYNPRHPGLNSTDPHSNWLTYYDYALVAIVLLAIFYFASKH